MSRPRQLSERARALLAEPAVTRKAALNDEQPFLRYAKAIEYGDRLEATYDHPRVIRPPCVILVGATNNGKSRILNRFVENHPRVDDPDTEASDVPVLLLQLAAPDPRALFITMLRNLNCPVQYKNSIFELQDQAFLVGRAVGLKVLVVDEFSNMLNGTPSKQRSFLAYLRVLSNELKINIVCAGLPEAMQALASDTQLNSRFKALVLPRWSVGDQSRQLLATLEATLPLREQSHLGSRDIASQIISLSGGSIGEIVEIVKLAFFAAIDSGAERITPEIIGRLDYVHPDERRRRVGLAIV